MTTIASPFAKVTNRTWFRKLKSRVSKSIKVIKRVIFEEAVTRYIIYITSIISFMVIFEASYDGLIVPKFGLMPFLSTADKLLVKDFVEWFGVLYGFLLPQILVRVWEQFDEIDNIFDSEADAIKILAEDMSLLREDLSEIRTKILKKLLAYSVHVQKHHAEEVKFAHVTRKKTKKDIGAEYLKDVRDLYKGIIHQPNPANQEISSLVSELLRELNTVIDLRGDRISLSSERLYESLRYLAIITSIVWLVPFYFLYYQTDAGVNLPLGIFGWLLIIVVTFLVVMILTIIDDLDNPFDGLWKINIDSWDKLITDIEGMLNKKSQKNSTSKLPELQVTPET
jgi:hypothetical protein